MSDDLQFITNELRDIKTRLTGLEDDVNQVCAVQGRLFDCLKDIESSVVKMRESLLKIRSRLG